MKLSPFRVHRPTTVDEASGLSNEYGLDALYLAGGTELVLLIKLGLAQPSEVIDLKRVAGLRKIMIHDDRITIGATVTHYQVEKHDGIRKVLPELCRVASVIANRRVRGTGTMVGNVCFADPHSDPATLLSALGAELTLTSASSQRRVAISDFLVGAYETVLEQGELVTAIDIPMRPAIKGVSHQRFKLKERPTVTVSAVRRDTTTDGFRVVAGCVEPTPVRIAQVEDLLTSSGHPSPRDLAANASAAIDPLDEDQASMDYQRHLVGVLTSRAVGSILDREPA